MCPVRTYEIWPAQHDWLRRYFVFERAAWALEWLTKISAQINIS